MVYIYPQKLKFSNPGLLVQALPSLALPPPLPPQTNKKMRDNAQREQSHTPIISGASYRATNVFPMTGLGFCERFLTFGGLDQGAFCGSDN